MDSFNTYLVGIYKEFDFYIKEYYRNNTDEEDPEFVGLQSFINVGLNLIDLTDIRSLDMGFNNRNRELLMCLCFFSGNEQVYRPLIDQCHHLFANKVISKNFVEGIPFCFAIPFGNKDLLSLLVSYGMDISLKIDNSYLMTAVLYANVEAYDFFIANSAALNHANSNGDTAMLFAAMNGDDTLVERLAKAGEDLKAVNHHGFNVFICAAFHNQATTISLLARLIERAHGKKRLLAMLDLKDKDGETPLHIASRLGFPKSVKALLDCGSEINISNKNKCTPLDLAKKGLQMSKKSSANSANAADKGANFIDEIESLEYVRQLLPADFKEKLSSRFSLLKKAKKTTKSYQKVIKIFDDYVKQKEQEITKNLEALLLASESQQSTKKSKRNTTANNSKNKQTKSSSSSTPTTPTSNDKSNNKKKLIPTLEEQTKNESQNQAVQLDLDIIKDKDNKDLEEEHQKQQEQEKGKRNVKEQEKEKEKEKEEQLIDSKQTTTVVENTTPSTPSLSRSPQLSLSSSLSPSLSPSSSPSLTPNHLQQQQFYYQQQQLQQLQQQSIIDYREKYRELAVLYLEQANRLKETINQLTEIEDTFIQFKETLYESNEKAEVLGLGVSEILGIGLEYLSTEQLDVLSSIHADHITEIEKQKAKLGQYNKIHDF